MQVKFGSLELELIPTQLESFEARLPGGFWLACFKSNCEIGSPGLGSWMAKMKGPWYGDSDPYAHGHTSQEAVATLARDVLILCDDFAELKKALNS